MKKCVRCGEIKHLTEFHKQKKNVDGFKTYCKACAPKKTDEQREIDRIRKREEYNKDPNKRKEQKREYFINKTKTDKVFRLKCTIQNSIRFVLKGGSYQNNEKMENIYGCTFEEFKTHIENQFEDWMTWENKGLYNGSENYGWDIDHIIPLSTAKTEEDVIKLNHHTNLRPLCSYVNRVENIRKYK